MIKVNLLIGDKSPIYNKNQTNTGEGRHHESPFFQLLADKVEFNQVDMYRHNLPLPAKFSHIAHHFLHPFTLRGKIRKKAITHIMFGEESSLLKFIKPSETTIVSCLDLIPLVQPEGLNPKNAKFLSWCHQGLKKADHIIANSEFTKKEIHQHLQIPNEKITVIHPPVAETFKPLSQISQKFIEKYQLNRQKKHLLYVGALDLPRKNVKTLIEAFKLISKNYPDLELLLIGHAYRKSRLEPLEKLAEDSPIRFIQDVPEKDLLQFYNLAELFIFPSLYEGFGLPPAEAMACGTPVISSDAASLPEVIGDGGLMVDCTDPQTLADKISTTINSPELLRTLSKKGQQQAQKFSWNEHTRKHLELYSKLQSNLNA